MKSKLKILEVQKLPLFKTHLGSGFWFFVHFCIFRRLTFIHIKNSKPLKIAETTFFELLDTSNCLYGKYEWQENYENFTLWRTNIIKSLSTKITLVTYGTRFDNSTTFSEIISQGSIFSKFHNNTNWTTFGSTDSNDTNDIGMIDILENTNKEKQEK